MQSLHSINDQLCPLCNGSAEMFFDDMYFQCRTCSGIFLASQFYPTAEREKQRYEEHNNDVNDLGYQQFVSPITDAVLQDFSPMHSGLDFGSGTGPVTSKILQDHGYTIAQYDPFFANYPEVLQGQYDYITCCEVIEHFHAPAQEFALLYELLKPGGSLYCMTFIYNNSIQFKNWVYKNDDTHVFFYQEPTLYWIQNNFGFSSLTIRDRLIKFVR